MLAHWQNNLIKVFILGCFIPMYLFAPPIVGVTPGNASVEYGYEGEILGMEISLKCKTKIPDVAILIQNPLNELCGILQGEGLTLEEKLAGKLADGLAGFLDDMLGSETSTQCKIGAPNLMGPYVDDLCKKYGDTREIIFVPSLLEAAGSILSKAIDPTEPVALDDIKLFNGKKYTEVFGDEGKPSQLKQAIDEDPHGPAASIVKSFDTCNDLLLEEISTQTNKNSLNEVDLNEIKLSENKGVLKKDELFSVENFNLQRPKIPAYIKALALKLKQHYVVEVPRDSMRTLLGYRQKEQNLTAVFLDLPSDELAPTPNSNFTNVFRKGKDNIYKEYAFKRKIKSQEPSFVNNPTEEGLEHIIGDKKNKYRCVSLVQVAKNTLKTREEATKLAKLKEKMDLAVDIAVISAKMFRDDIAKLELDDLLAAADASVTLP